MQTVFVLMMYASGTSQSAVTTQEFLSREKCNAAGLTMEAAMTDKGLAMENQRHLIWRCTQK